MMHEWPTCRRILSKRIFGHVSGHRAGVAGVYNRATYLDQRRDALEKYADHIRGLTRAKLAVVK